MTDDDPETGGLFAELRRRKVIRVALVYAVVGWLLIQVAEITFEPLNLPDWTLTLVVMLTMLGFPLALVLAWAFELTPQGLKRDSGSTSGDVSGISTELVDKRSVAVLPFVDMSPGKDQAYFCDGIAEEILNVLAKLDELRVASRTSSFSHGEGEKDIRSIGQDLKVATVLEGSVRKSGDQLRVTAQLIDVATGYPLWTERFDREMEDIFAIQDEIASNVARALETTLSPDDCKCVGQLSRSTSNAKAYDLYLKGWSFFHRSGGKNMKYALQMFERAIEEDPDFSRAWAALADAYANLYIYADANAEYRVKAREASDKAFSLCPNQAETHTSVGIVHVMWEEWAEAEEHFKKAMELDPNLFEAALFFGRACVHQGKTRQAAELFDRAASIRPEDYASRLIAGQIYGMLGEQETERAKYVDGIRLAELRLLEHPDDTRAIYLMAAAMAKLGDKSNAIAQAERAMQLEPGDPAVLYNVACTFSLIGEIDRALDCLESAGLPLMANLTWVESDPDFKPLSGHPRFEAILDTLRKNTRIRQADSKADGEPGG
jgi:TolB-like protein/Flp pilus assembly protein TadD